MDKSVSKRMFLRFRPVTVLESSSTIIYILLRTGLLECLSVFVNVRSLLDSVILSGLTFEIVDESFLW